MSEEKKFNFSVDGSGVKLSENDIYRSLTTTGNEVGVTTPLIVSSKEYEFVNPLSFPQEPAPHGPVFWPFPDNNCTQPIPPLKSIFPAKLVTCNKKVAVEPFEDVSVRTEAKGDKQVKVMHIENKTKMSKLKVVFPSEDGRFIPGKSVMLRGELYTQFWAKEIHEHDGQKFILVPEDKIEAIIAD